MIIIFFALPDIFPFSAPFNKNIQKQPLVALEPQGVILLFNIILNIVLFPIQKQFGGRPPIPFS